MARTKISEFSPIPGNNTDIDNINIAEGCPPSSINNAIRELMAQLKDFQAGTAGDSFNGPIGTTTTAAGAFTTLSASGAFTYGGVTLSNAVTGTGNMVLSNSPTLVTPALGTPSSATLTNATGLPIATGVSGLGTGVATFLATPSSANLAAAVSDETGTGALVFANSPTLVTPALGTPSALVGTNITGTAAGLSIGGNAATATTSTNVSGGTASVTTLTTSGAVTHNAGTANGVAFLNASKVLTTGSALTFDGSAFSTTGTINAGTAAKAYRVANWTLAGYSGNTLQFGNATTGGEWTDMSWSIAGSEQMRLTSTGLGIGTSSPTAKLQISSGAGGDSTGLRITRTDAGGGDWRIWSTATANGEGGGKLIFGTASNYMTLDASGNLGVGTTSPGARLHVGAGRIFLDQDFQLTWQNAGTNRARIYGDSGNNLIFENGSGNTERARITSGGDLLVGTTSAYTFSSGVITAGQLGATTNSSGNHCAQLWNQSTSGDNIFVTLFTEGSGSPAQRGSITYNRGAGLVAYNVTSDYRAKDIIGPVTDSGALIDSVPVYMGKMKGATQERPMFIAHEVPAYAHTGEKDAVDADGNPVYQQMDASALVPVMWAELQSLRARVAQLESN